MEDFTSYFQKLLKQPVELNSDDMELLNNYPHQALNDQQLGSHVHGVLEYSTGLQFSSAGNSSGTQSLFCPFDQESTHVAQSLPSIQGIERHEKSAMPMSDFADIPSSPGYRIEYGGNRKSDKNNGMSARKRKRKNEGEVEKPREVVHVRAKRGQATDSHSLAERVRRERINEKLKVLQDLVPGCYKTMGMAVMLDVIINYVRSLQNQIEVELKLENSSNIHSWLLDVSQFLSMKLSAASLFYDFNSPEAEALETLQRTASSYEAHEIMKRMPEEGCNGGITPLVQSTWPF
ncbi:hypothetical protein Cgig2_001608 [Carnegiea gigantea]|uniref:BHLH domain-containing protein n=1 Tax=Carnegiea gigantea TaxID=171969 RepID=A0A9Q1KBF5_9CARY|nr:hypothetical protein Cgig2_001608 [Carnegiea gigantea]